LPGDPQQERGLLEIAARVLQDARQQEPVHLPVRLRVQVTNVGPDPLPDDKRLHAGLGRGRCLWGYLNAGGLTLGPESLRRNKIALGPKAAFAYKNVRDDINFVARGESLRGDCRRELLRDILAGPYHG
jgi:hypothetical protein